MSFDYESQLYGINPQKIKDKIIIKTYFGRKISFQEKKFVNDTIDREFKDT